jgi:hypothetical protein
MELFLMNKARFLFCQMSWKCGVGLCLLFPLTLVEKFIDLYRAGGNILIPLMLANMSLKHEL